MKGGQMVHTEVPQSRTNTVLFIDDDENDLKKWSALLRNYSSTYRVLEANSGEAGLDIYRSRAVDCVILDLDMPTSGFHTLLELNLNRHRPRIAVVIFTHLPSPNLHDMAKSNGAQSCLLKQRTSSADLDQAIQGAIVTVQSYN